MATVKVIPAHCVATGLGGEGVGGAGRHFVTPGRLRVSLRTLGSPFAGPDHSFLILSPLYSHWCFLCGCQGYLGGVNSFLFFVFLVLQDIEVKQT